MKTARDDQGATPRRPSANKPEAATLHAVEASLATVLPTTQYFEVDSDAVGARFAVWVTTPPRYEADPHRHYGVIYQPDGNKAAPTTVNSLIFDDPINPIEPFIQVQVGYVGDDSRRMLAVRARDLLPPGEPLEPSTDEGLMEKLVSAGLLSAPDADLYLHNLRNPAGDRFLTFLSDELHPAIAARFRVDDTRLGLHGYSYGGLFASWVAFQRTIFTRIGAGSPGIVPDTSRVFDVYDAESACGADYCGRSLHVTICATELTDSSYYQRGVGLGTMQLLHRLRERPLPALRTTSEIHQNESHATGSALSYFSYLRACWAADDRPIWLA